MSKSAAQLLYAPVLVSKRFAAGLLPPDGLQGCYVLAVLVPAPDLSSRGTRTATVTVTVTVAPLQIH